MEHKLDCAVVHDLLPSYVDGLTSDATNRAVEEHLSGCESCNEELQRMKEPEPQSAAPVPEVDYLKKVRRRSTAKSLVVGIVLMLLGIALLSYRLFYIGSEAAATEVYCNVSVAQDGTLNLSGTLTSSGLAVSRVTFSDSNGMVQAKVYTAPKMFFNSGDFSASYAVPGGVTQVRMDDLIIWEDGKHIDSMTSQLFAAMNPFVGDMPSNARIASILGVADQFGPYTNELHTSSESYGWTLMLENLIALEDEGTALDIMAADSYVMLATIQNLDYVTWQYRTAEGAREYIVTTADASAYADRDIKLCAESISELQRLVQSLGIKRAAIGELMQEDGNFRLDFTSNCDAEICGFGIDYYLDGELIGSRAFRNADNPTLAKGCEVAFGFIPNDFPEGTSSAELSGFSFDFSVMTADGSETVVREGIPVEAKYAWTFFYTLTGDFENGFTLNEG